MKKLGCNASRDVPQMLSQKLLAIIQDGFPLVERPYKALAEMLNVSEQDVFDEVEKMRASGVIRRIGGVYDSKKLGFISRLCAGKVPASSLDFSAEPHSQTPMEKFATVVMSEPAITHNYVRSHEYNVWFTVIAENEAEILRIVDKLCNATDLHDVHVMSATRKFKINTVMALDERRKTKDERGERCGAAAAPVDSRQFVVGWNSDERGTALCFDKLSTGESSRTLSPTSCHPERSAVGAESKDLSESDKIRIRTACEDIPHSLTPFKDWGVSCEELREDLALKRMRRFGAILRHQNAGFAFNAMVCFGVSLENVAAAGSVLASNPHISHCYERPSFEGFPYNVYAMMHANSAELLDQYVADCVNDLSALQASSVDYVVLQSVQELKKTSFKFFA
ncbi:Lrp/AsnC family transcriptional regulator [Fibrobacter sp.]|uniref:Lrp/AsnC family transcriptional regulator n=1 Tax=Fibrobacter sp. TaxID=35828 RepID=UPI00386FF456